MRTYLIFGSDDGKYWEQLGEVVVGGAQQALNQARAKESYNHYATCTVRNWAAMTPEEVVRDPVVKWKPMVPGQLTVDDAIETVNLGAKDQVQKLSADET